MELVAAKFLHLFPIKLYVGVTVVAWGITMMCTAAPHNFAGMMVARFFLGLCEGSVPPAFIVLISHWSVATPSLSLCRLTNSGTKSPSTPSESPSSSLPTLSHRSSAP